ncbi:acetyl-CoA synthetase-like protein [Lophiostoma macrostomum CBS 122681]|uniref:Acetyl-CoA synthetase-like protein n=1 Tax=Lophiostoma macrostomum CBS 122681 TaxID=1314788 RepID=A0A6A6SQZ5_9PLEO|nr:acetyl-CoA synthetase-like protein [Lophiostoma macrostomum CBS 122681]
MHNNYFTCTLGQATGTKAADKPYRTIGEFLDFQGHHNANLPAVGFPVPNRHGSNWGAEILTFRDIDRGLRVVAEKLIESCGPAIQGPRTVALLADSSADFLFVWLALIRLGCSVLLIAPQCQASAIAHLCKSCSASLLFHDDAHAGRAVEASSLMNKDASVFNAIPIPLEKEKDVFEIIQESPTSELDHPDLEETAVAYLNHTSGTSSGLPKPIPQSHRAAIGVLPSLPFTPSSATFTTTPLYHGGIADLFRAWTSNALIWLFPGKAVPITCRNICHCLEVANESFAKGRSPAIKYFSSVPYVLQMMEADETGLTYLKDMAIVGVGGAALPAEVGNRLVSKGVHLISRFGSAECGFILSSYRDFETDGEWQYLRDSNPQKLIAFDAREGGLAELVIKPGWPHMAKTNRPDGSFATADLFAPHPNIENAWLYHSRADSQLTLITGKKFDPAPLEDSMATSTLLDDVLIFGENQPFPGALLLRSKKAKDLSDDDLLQEIRPIVEKLNADSQSHAQIPVNMLVPLSHQAKPLEKSSKGTIIRRAAEARFRSDIERAYKRLESNNDAFIEDKDLPAHLIELIKTIKLTDEPLDQDTELFSYGMDSIACMQLRYRLQQLISNSDRELPLSIVEDCGSVKRLTEYLIHSRHGATDFQAEDEEQLMLNLVEQYSDFNSTPSKPAVAQNEASHPSQKSETVLLTGATGALGAHLLHLLRASPHITHIYCLVRGSDSHAARSRVDKALSQKGLPSLSTSNPLNEKITTLPASLSAPDLSLSSQQYNDLASQISVIIHVAWTVNFRLKLRSFEKDNIAGVHHLLRLALSSTRARAPRFLYCSSTAAVINSHSSSSSSTISETISQSPTTSSPLGYSRSKWVAEQICANAARDSRLEGRVAVLRVGQLSGDTQRGVWNEMEAWPMMLSTAGLIGCLPDLRGEVVDWLAVDVAAGAFLQAAVGREGEEKMQGEGEGEEEEVGKHGGCRVYHVLNEHRTPSWGQMLEWLQKKEKLDQKEGLQIVRPEEWVEKLEACRDSEHPALKLLGMWKEAYGDVKPSDGEEKDRKGYVQEKARPRFEMQETKGALPIMQGVKPVDEEYMGKIWEWVKENVG